MSEGQADPKVLVIAFDVFEKSTRARKFCRVYREAGAEVQYLGMSAPGRSGRWGEPGDSVDGGVAVHHVPMRRPEGGTGPTSQARNLALSYVPALARMAAFAWRRPATVVHVVAAPLSPLGILHHLRHRSRFVLDVQERPGAVATPGSLSSVFAKVERAVLAVASRLTSAATVVTPPDVHALEQIGFSPVHLVRNAPLASWRAPYRAPDLTAGVTTFACIGTIFQGRAYELLIDATALAAARVPIRVQISGTGSDEYMAQLRERAERSGAAPHIDWRGWVSSDQVCDRYLDAAVGLVLYEPSVKGNDGLSNKLMECVSAGRPALCSDAPLNREFVTRYDVGWTTGPTAQDLADAMVAAAQADLAGIAAHCREVGDREISWEADAMPLVAGVLGRGSDPPVDGSSAVGRATGVHT